MLTISRWNTALTSVMEIWNPSSGKNYLVIEIKNMSIRNGDF